MQTFKFDKERINSFSQKQDSNEDLLYINELFSSKDHEAELEQFMRKQWYKLFQEDIGETKNLNHILYRIHYAINMNSVKSTINRRSNLGIIAKWFSRIAVVLVIPLAIYFVFSVNSKFKTKLNENLAWVEIKAPASTRASSAYLMEQQVG